MNKIMECVPNFSEGRDKEKIEKIVDCFRGKDNVKLLDYSNDEDHNRLVVTVVGEPEPLRDVIACLLESSAQDWAALVAQGNGPYAPMLLKEQGMIQPPA